MTKRINFLCNTLVGGGAEKQMLLCAKALAESGFDVGVFAISPGGDHPRYAALLASCEKAGVRFSIPRSRPGFLRVLCALIGRCNKHSILWTWGFRAEAVRLVVPGLRRPAGVCSLRDASGNEILKHRRLLTWGVAKTRRYVANTRRAVDLAERQIPGVGDKSVVLYNAIEAEFGAGAPVGQTRRGGRIRVAMLANILIEKKGYDIAVKCAERIRDEGLPVDLIIGGAPYEWDTLKSLIESAGVGSVIVYEGRISDPREFLGKADAFLLLSRFEGTPNALLEAMILGLPCASTDVGDVAVFASECPGLKLLPVCDAEAAFAVMKAWHESPGQAMADGESCRAYAQLKFSEQGMACAVTDIMRNLAAGLDSGR